VGGLGQRRLFLCHIPTHRNERYACWQSTFLPVHGHPTPVPHKPARGAHVALPAFRLPRHSPYVLGRMISQMISASRPKKKPRIAHSAPDCPRLVASL